MTATLRPIRNDDEHRAALDTIERLWDSKPGTPAHDRLEVLSILVEAYERAHHPVLPPDPIDAILFRMEQLGLRRVDVEEIFGGRSHLSEVLSGKRSLSLEMIREVQSRLDIPADVLIAKPAKHKAARRH